jgi:hypothetical protein
MCDARTKRTPLFLSGEWKDTHCRRRKTSRESIDLLELAVTARGVFLRSSAETAPAIRSISIETRLIDGSEIKAFAVFSDTQA